MPCPVGCIQMEWPRGPPGGPLVAQCSKYPLPQGWLKKRFDGMGEQIDGLFKEVSRLLWDGCQPAVRLVCCMDGKAHPSVRAACVQNGVKEDADYYQS